MADRITWTSLPAEARRAVESCAGRVTSARSAPAGVMSAFASTLHTSRGPVFVKGTPASHPMAWSYRHEAAVTRLAPLAPPVLWQAEAGGWWLAGYGFLHGRHPDLTPGSPDLAPLADALTVLSRQPWPASISKKPLADRVAAFIPDAGAEALAGRMLAHTDTGAFNLLVNGGGMRVLDWALSCPGPAWADAALMMPRLIAAGHTYAQAEQVARQIPAYADADPAHLSIFADTICAFWRHRTKEAPLPQRVKLVEAAEAWALGR